MKNTKPTFSFSKVSFKSLQKYFKIKIIYSEEVFDDWFGVDYIISDSDIRFLKKLISQHKLKLPSYMEEKLKAKFIIPILNRVDFFVEELDDWYEVALEHEFEEVILHGTVDYLVAKGSRFPETPYFFLQEFKPSQPKNDPEIQLIAQLTTALANNDEKTEIKGAYILGQLWRFAILQKTGEKTYNYFVSRPLDALVYEQLCQIYTNLQAVKQEILNEPNDL